MTALAIDALHAERELALEIGRSLTAEEWLLPSDCAGWRVLDLFAHMGATGRSIVAPGTVATVDSPDVERQADAAVDERRSRSPHEILAEYEEWSAKMIEVFAGMQSEPMATTVIPLGNLGSHPMHILADALVFDHYCHLRHDLLAPNGPLRRATLPSDDLRLTPTIGWMLGGLPQMSEAALRVVDRTFTLQLDGPGGGVWTISPGEPIVTITPGDAQDAAARASSTTHDFVCWGTQRRNWRACDVVVVGDEEYGAAVLDAINVI